MLTRCQFSLHAQVSWMMQSRLSGLTQSVSAMGPFDRLDHVDERDFAVERVAASIRRARPAWTQAVRRGSAP